AAFTVHGKGIVQGRECTILRSLDGATNPEEYWVDTHLQSAVVRWCRYSSAAVISGRIDIEYHPINGSWYPRVWTTTAYHRNRDTIEWSEIMNVNAFALNPPLQLAEFQIEPQPGENLHDLIKNRLYRANQDGTLEEFHPGRSEGTISLWWWIASA